MHSFPSYPAPTPADAVAFVRDHPFAILATSLPGAAPIATHTPVVFPPGVVAGDSLVGVRLWGHIGRANPHWQYFAEHPEMLLIFSTSHAYVSPSSYEFTPAVPTLDYATVHLTGRVTLFSEPEALAVVERTVEVFEARRSQPWPMEPSQHVFRKIIGGVVAFAIDIETENSMFKLSQDMEPDVHERVRQDLSAGQHQHPDVADLMGQVGTCPHSRKRSED
ncbi:FMN-binding negative transcriptional regulator [Leucobacter chromiireducens]|uniref:FMN-binding negative transcriptional regulator n=1 Tax=Leucobacter chromiireducens subsp. chromiireducens TaxID=660067 RepID=A0ABS1SNU5_9MICO|nr:FMN-binding negative transcriptional regulator [Leucobacter chromiireducens]MBL3688802.1 FMN-binding negative transcriptional regulator [Leucobacter chromiireducens subsp. chromiireducens]